MIISALIVAAAALLIPLLSNILQNRGPDAVYSRNVNGECFLTVAANSRIGEREVFAAHLIRMCRENRFPSLRFSTDLAGYPEVLDITVYQCKADVRKKEPVMHIRYEPRSDVENLDIRSSPGQYNLLIDGKKVRNMVR